MSAVADARPKHLYHCTNTVTQFRNVVKPGRRARLARRSGGHPSGRRMRSPTPSRLARQPGVPRRRVASLARLHRLARRPGGHPPPADPHRGRSVVLLECGLLSTMTLSPLRAVIRVEAQDRGSERSATGSPAGRTAPRIPTPMGRMVKKRRRKRPGVTSPVTSGRVVVQICCKGPDRTGASKENR